jgi:PleD family two-component response regulator
MQQATPLTVMLMKFGKHLSKESGDKGEESIMQQIGKVIAANIRQNDLAFRYDATTVAVVLGETGEKESMLAVDKLRKLLGAVQATGKDQPGSFAAGLAQAELKQQYDPVDIVTELINRVEQALEGAVMSPSKVLALPPAHAAAAVA